MFEVIEEPFTLAIGCMRCGRTVLVVQDVFANESCRVTATDAVDMLGCNCYKQRYYVTSKRSTSNSCSVGRKQNDIWTVCSATLLISNCFLPNAQKCNTNNDKCSCNEQKENNLLIFS